jgi:hypothetical protein
MKFLLVALSLIGLVGCGSRVIAVEPPTNVDVQSQREALKELGAIFRPLEGGVLINLNGSGVTDAGLEQLKGISNLQRLRLSDTKITDAGVAALTRSLPKCWCRAGRR